MLASLSHELRTPLNCSISMLTILEDIIQTKIIQNQSNSNIQIPPPHNHHNNINKENLAEEFQQYIDQYIHPALCSNKLLGNIVNDILDYSLIQRNQLNLRHEYFYLRDLAEEAMNLITFQCKLKNIDQRIEIDSALISF